MLTLPLAEGLGLRLSRSNAAVEAAQSLFEEGWHGRRHATCDNALGVQCRWRAQREGQYNCLCSQINKRGGVKPSQHSNRREAWQRRLEKELALYIYTIHTIHCLLEREGIDKYDN